MDRAEFDAVRALIERGECPICHKRYGQKAPKATVMQHLRLSKEAGHMLWKTRWWKIVFAKGHYCNHPRDEDKLVTELKREIKNVYGTCIFNKVCAVN